MLISNVFHCIHNFIYHTRVVCLKSISMYFIHELSLKDAFQIFIRTKYPYIHSHAHVSNHFPLLQLYRHNFD